MVKNLFLLFMTGVFLGCGSSEKQVPTAPPLVETSPTKHPWTPMRTVASVAEQIKSIDPNKKTICAMTLNSVEEREVFKAKLGYNFNVIELVTEKNEDWLKQSCESGVRCDVLIVSGHFGGSFFGTAGSLSLEDMEARSCEQQCSGIFKHPREVFLMGCNTLAGKLKDNRTPEQYVQVLINDGFSRIEAQRIAAFRYSPLGHSFEARMRKVFSGPRTAIYGFDSVGPSGKNVESMLKRYLNKIPNYQNHLEKLDTRKGNQILAKELRLTTFAQTAGDPSENPVCVLNNQKAIHEKFQWIESVLANQDQTLKYLPNIQNYFETLEGNFPNGLPDAEQSYWERLAQKRNLWSQIEILVRQPIDGLLAVQFDVLKFAREMTWVDSKRYREVTQLLIGDLFKTNLTREQADTFCSLNLHVDLRLEDLTPRPWSKETVEAIGCSKTNVTSVHEALVETMQRDLDRGVIYYAASALGEIKPADLKIHRALVQTMKNDSRPWVRQYAVVALRETKPTDPTIHWDLVETMQKDSDGSVRAHAANALGEIKPADPKIHWSLVESMQKDSYRSVRRYAASALGEIKPADPKIHWSLVETMLKDSDRGVRRYAASALGEIKPADPKIHWALVETMRKDSDLKVRTRAYFALSEIKPTDHNIREVLRRLKPRRLRNR